MKLTLTQDEILSAIKKSIGIDVSWEQLEIIIATAPYVEAIQEALALYPGSDQKIAAIKFLREKLANFNCGSTQNKFGIGLAEAKCAIENPSHAIEYWNQNGKACQYS